jgi:hypothetical protein
VNDEQWTEHKRARYLRLIALRDRVDRVASRAAKRIHAHEGLDEFWLGVRTSTEIVNTWPAWKRDAGRVAMGGM